MQTTGLCDRVGEGSRDIVGAGSGGTGAEGAAATGVAGSVVVGEVEAAAPSRGAGASSGPAETVAIGSRPAWSACGMGAGWGIVFTGVLASRGSTVSFSCGTGGMSGRSIPVTLGGTLL